MSDSTDKLLWHNGLQLALAQLENFASSPDLAAQLALVFGATDPEAAQQLITDLGLGLALPEILVADRDLLHGAIGAFADHQIYLSRNFLQANQQNPQVVAGVILEEIGHYLDSLLQSTDSPGDEGAIFAATVMGRTLTDRELAGLRQENDRGIIMINGRSIAAEFATYGSINVDGSLGDWQVFERLDNTPALTQSGYEIYGKYADNAYLFGISSAQSIDNNSTIWLNTDRNIITGYQVFGFAGGNEFNIQVGADGTTALYSGAEGQTFVSNLDYALSGDRQQLEVAVPTSLLGAVAPIAIDVQADVNNGVFLPGDYNLNRYTVAQNPSVNKTTYGDISLDGSLSDWKKSDRLDLLPGSGQAGYQVFGKATSEGYAFGISSPVAIGPNSTIWLNTDRNVSTGFQIFGVTGGAELSINIDANGQANLYGGAPGTNPLGRVDYSFNADRTVLEVAIDQQRLPVTSNGINVLADVNDQVFLPGNYNGPQYTVNNSILPARTNPNSRKIGIIYSDTSADRFFDKKSYQQLYASAQNQAMQAGVTFDLLTEDDLKDLTKVVQYDSLLFPSFNNVKQANVEAIENNLITASSKYGVGLIAAGDFMSADENGVALAGDPSRRLKELFDVSRTAGGGVAASTINIKDTSLLGSTYSPGEELASYNNLSFAVYGGLNQGGTVLADQTVNGQKYNAVVATQTGGRNVHFANETIMTDSNLLWQSLDWSVYDKQPHLQLDITRNNGVFISRDDVDRSKSLNEAVLVETKLGNILTEWKQKYNFVGSHYINIGIDANDPRLPPYSTPSTVDPEGPNWDILRSVYQKWLDLGNEIGTHSNTHPFSTSLLTPAQLEFEFNQSRQEISRQLGINVTGASIPGNPENLAVDQELSKYFSYITGVGSTYKNAMGFLTPDSSAVYFAPNISFDFNLIEFNKLTAAQTSAQWAKEYADLTKHGNHPLIEFSWHDYGVTETPSAVLAGYQRSIYDPFIAKAAADGNEFITLADAQQRLRAFEKADLTFSQQGNQIVAQVLAQDVGKFALDVVAAGSGQQIQNVTNYYAYDNNSIFLTKGGGEFQINLGSAADRVTHLSTLAARAELLAVDGDGRNLDFSFNGEGKVIVTLGDLPAGQNWQVAGADRFVIDGDRLELTFDRNGLHQVAVTFGNTVQPPTPEVLNITEAVGEIGDRPTNRSIDLQAVVGGNQPIPQDGYSRIVVQQLRSTNPDLVKPVVVGDRLALEYQFYQFGGAAVFLEFTAGNQAVQATFNVQVQADSAVIEGTAGDDLLTATDNNTILKGSTGSDTLVGGAGDDRLVGVAVGRAIAGTNEIDQLTGGAGADLFVLGDGQQTYYSTGNGYALIQDFNGDDGDIIQLTGKASDYILTAATSPAGQSALAIQKVVASGNQTIGLVVGASVLDLNGVTFGYLS